MEKKIPLSEKYRPKIFSDLIGQEIAIAKVRLFLNSFLNSTSKKNAILLHGPAGVGKTSIAHVAAAELGFELFELNASDLRNRQKLDEILKPSTLQKSLFGKGKIILVDEVDGVTSTEYGGLAELIALIGKTQFPIIITSNDVWKSKFSMLRSKCELVPIKEIPYLHIFELLKKITVLEKKELEESLIKEIAAKSRGDLRAALNDLQSVLYLESKEAGKDGIDLREKNQDIFNALKEVLKVRTNTKTIEAFENVDLELDQVALWLEENLPNEYRGEELAQAFQALSNADVFKGRIYRQQYWHFLVYQNFFLTAGVSSAKGLKTNNRFTRYNPPKRILKIWMANQRNAKKKSIAAKFAELTHTNKKRAERDFLILSLIVDEHSIKDMQLSEEEQTFLEEKKVEVLNQLRS